ncbi:MAG: hypothetical protein KKC50_08215 [Candidatus Omnitrophica bacterium]|nr:hypothetical protein [Candidatus Omnitrophota bacterium]
MGAITGTLVDLKGSGLAGGGYKLIEVTATVASASDTITLTQADHGITEVIAVYPAITGGFDAAFTQVYATASGLVITVTSLEADGTPATDFTGTTIKLLVLGSI